MNRFSDKYRVANRFISVATLASALGAIVHAFLILFFFYIEVKEMGYYNIFSTIFFITMYQMLKKNRNPEWVYFLISIEVVLHAYLATYYVGFFCGFGYFILVLLPAFLLNIKWEKWQVYTYFSVTILAYYILYLLFDLKEPIYELDTLLVKQMNLGLKLSSGFIILAQLYFFSFLVNQNDKELRRVNKILYKRNEEKTMMMNETHHRVKNNLQMVITLLRLQASKINDDEIVSMFKETQNRVMTIASLHEKMYQIDNIKHINAKEYITRLTNDIVKNFTVYRDIKTSIDVEDVNLSTQIMIPLSLVINEIITNSLKYAFKDLDRGTISIKLQSVANNKYELFIGDDGYGFSYDDNNEGLGTKLIRVFVEQLNGTITKKNEGGTQFKIIFTGSTITP